MAIVVRAAVAEDGEVLRALDRLAGERFREAGLPDVADDEPLPVSMLADYARAGRSWAAVDDENVPIGYVLVGVVDGNAHIEQVSVRPDHQGAGRGRALIDQVCAWAIENEMAAVTLTTFADLPWNAPLYAHLGFRVVAEHDLGPELRAVRNQETAHGLDPTTRVCMRLALNG